MAYDCTKCFKPIKAGDEREAFGQLYHAACAPRTARRIKREVHDHDELNAIARRIISGYSYAKVGRCAVSGISHEQERELRETYDLPTTVRLKREITTLCAEMAYDQDAGEGPGPGGKRRTFKAGRPQPRRARDWQKPIKAAPGATRCNCESTLCGHGYPCPRAAGRARACYVGAVCDACASGLGRRYLLTDAAGRETPTGREERVGFNYGGKKPAVGGKKNNETEVESAIKELRVRGLALPEIGAYVRLRNKRELWHDQHGYYVVGRRVGDEHRVRQEQERVGGKRRRSDLSAKVKRIRALARGQ